jgi:hypothetical protein
MLEYIEMTDNEKEYMESLYAGLAMMGYLIRGNPIHKIPEDAKAMAKAMMEDEKVIGLPAIKRRTKK